MPIQILPPQLANQIAAGEVVERPASVVKELVENSLDAGATQLQIDIENGGANLIRIRDNGLGIPKDELRLALARHATSKISTLEDLESILSLGFRGEALASISSVSRLTLTSRTAEQTEAWQVFAQGREMETTIKPASHPVGATVEVCNLFFNTPARRKFLRTEKTEFIHIDEVIRRIALAKPNIAITLTHNGKTVRQYKQALNDKQKLKRLSAICGEEFIKNALHIDWKHGDLHLSGWIARPQFSRAQNDLAYSYINGRMVRDKVITHAIRQAYGEFLNTAQFPAFVLYLDLNPLEVDVNVHPTKHEVRFQQARLIHDFIYQGIKNALNAQTDFTFEQPPQINEVREPAPVWQATPHTNRAAAGKNIFTSEENGGSIHSSSPTYSERTKTRNFTPHFRSPSISKTINNAYSELLSSPEPSIPSVAQNKSAVDMMIISSETPTVPQNVLKVFSLVQNQALLCQRNEQIYLLPIKKLQQIKYQLHLQQADIATQGLLIPITFRLDKAQQQHWQQQQQWFEKVGFRFNTFLAQSRITLISVPLCLRQKNLQKCVISTLSQPIIDFSQFLTALLQQVEMENVHILADALTLLAEVEQLLKTQSEIKLEQYFIEIDITPYLTGSII